jgi:hypothetical protein
VVTANELHLPVGASVRLDLESADVMHSFWLAQFGWMRLERLTRRRLLSSSQCWHSL